MQNGGRDRDRTCDPYDVNVVPRPSCHIALVPLSLLWKVHGSTLSPHWIDLACFQIAYKFMTRITKRTIDSLKAPATGSLFVWDSELRGFGVRVSPQGRVAFIVQYRVRGRSRRYSFAVFGPTLTEPEIAKINFKTSNDSGMPDGFAKSDKGVIYPNDYDNIALALDKLGIVVRKNDFKLCLELKGTIKGQPFDGEINDDIASRVQFMIKDAFHFLPSDGAFLKVIADIAFLRSTIRSRTTWEASHGIRRNASKPFLPSMRTPKIHHSIGRSLGYGSPLRCAGSCNPVVSSTHFS